MNKDILLLLFQILLIVGFGIAYFLRDKSKDKQKEDSWLL